MRTSASTTASGSFRARKQTSNHKIPMLLCPFSCARHRQLGLTFKEPQMRISNNTDPVVGVTDRGGRALRASYAPSTWGGLFGFPIISVVLVLQ